MSLTLTEEQIRHIARTSTASSTPALRAVIDVESGGAGFYLGRGRPAPRSQDPVRASRDLQAAPDSGPGDQPPKKLATEHPELCGRSWDPKQYPYGPRPCSGTASKAVIAWAQKCGPGSLGELQEGGLRVLLLRALPADGLPLRGGRLPFDVYEFKHAMEIE
jgi:hypothetical protein